MATLTRTVLLRWAAPVAAAASVGLVASGVLTAQADPPLPPKTAAQLLADVQGARVDGLSGTIVQDSDLGLPALPDIGSGHGGSSLTSLLTGSHTLRVWYAGDTKQRLALLGSLGETDVVRNGQDAWFWSSDSNSATHYKLPPPSAHKPEPTPPSPLTPQQAAQQALAAIDPTTSVSTDGTRPVAGRKAYELVLAPRDSRSLIGQVRIAVDALTSVPLRVQVFSRASAAGPAFSVGFTRVSFEVPGADQFRFSPPPGATVTEGRLPADHPATGELPRTGAQPKTGPQPKTGTLPEAGSAPTTVGTGWTTVAIIREATPSAGKQDRTLSAFLDGLPRVSGSWGSGRLLTSKLVSALLTDDGRLLVGAVPPDLLYAAAAR